jgi:hypothetical protein
MGRLDVGTGNDDSRTDRSALVGPWPCGLAARRLRNKD